MCIPRFFSPNIGKENAGACFSSRYGPPTRICATATLLADALVDHGCPTYLLGPVSTRWRRTSTYLPTVTNCTQATIFTSHRIDVWTYTSNDIYFSTVSTCGRTQATISNFPPYQRVDVHKPRDLFSHRINVWTYTSNIYKQASKTETGE